LESTGVDEMSLDDIDLDEMSLDQMDLGEMNLDDEFTSISLDSNDDIWDETDNNLGSDFDDLDSLLGDSGDGFGLDSIEFEESDDNLAAADDGSFSDLDDFLSFDQSSSSDLDFAGIDDFAGAAVLGTGLVTGGAIAANLLGSQFDDDPEFGDLEKLLEDRDLGSGGAPVPGAVRPAGATRRPAAARPSKGLGEQTMRVPVKHLDNLSNLVGELVVNRNSLEQDQERMRQSLDNLLYQVQQLSDVGQRMQDLYERSLLESSLLASRQSYRMASSAPRKIVELEKTNDVEYDPLEMDRFTGFHSLSQEMIELIVRVRESASDIEFIVDETDQVTRMFRQVTTQLQEGLTRSRMVPFAQTADRMPRAVRDIAMKCGKQAELVIEGRETPIDKMLLEHLYDPMTHLVNNAITHGIETPEERRRAGKSDTGRITIRAFYQGNQTVISVSDDGAGIDIERVKVKAIEKGLITAAESQTMSRLDVYDLLFHPGFTTRDQADDFAGRGVGMDVVRTSLSEIRGSVTTDSTLNRGTTFTVRLPLTLSISKALCCVSDRARIAFPMDGVEDMLDMPKDRLLINAEGQPYIRWRDSELVLRPLTELLAHNRHLGRGNVYGGNQEEDMISVVVLRSVGNYLALQVDQVIGEQEIVIKQLEGPVPKPVGIAGATVLGDGRIMPIADVLELIDLSMGHIRRDAGSMWDQNAMPPQEIQPAKTEPMVLIVDDSITVRELLSMTFNKVGYRVEQARDGQEAWEKLRAGLPCDIVFCDIEMPRMDGLELLSRIQKDPVLKALPIAMLTSRGADRHRQMAASLGASGYFTKPYLEEALLDAAGRMLKGEVLLVSDQSE
jgi:chemotaxis protein histidine kinase CheA/CheY-like chemotaxis protein